MEPGKHSRTCPPGLWSLVKDLQEWPEVQVLRLGGSVARGQADEFSDVEFYAACTSIPPLDRRQQFIALRRDRGTAFFLDEAALWGKLDTFLEADQEVTIVFQEVTTIEQGLTGVLAGLEMDREKEMAFGQEILDAEILYDAHGLAAQWQAWARAYPASLQRLIQSGLAQWQQQLALELAATRDDPLWAAYRLQETWEWLVHGLCALHGHYYIGPKRGLATLATFVESPPEAVSRLSESWLTDLNPGALHAVWRQVSAEVLAEGKRTSPPEFGEDGLRQARRDSPEVPRFPPPPGATLGWLRGSGLERTRERSQGTLSRTLEKTLENPRDRGPEDAQTTALARAFHRGCDCIVERLQIAAQREDRTGFLFYQQKTLQALIQVLGGLQGWTGAGPLTYPSGMRPLRSLRPAPPALYDRLCGLWSGSYRREALLEKRRQWMEIWNELVPLLYHRYPTLDLSAAEQALS